MGNKCASKDIASVKPNEIEIELDADGIIMWKSSESPCGACQEEYQYPQTHNCVDLEMGRNYVFTMIKKTVSIENEHKTVAISYSAKVNERTKILVISYRHGVIHGLVYSYYLDAPETYCTAGEYKNGKRDGVFKQLVNGNLEHLKYENGIFIRKFTKVKTEYYPNGEIKAKIDYDDCGNKIKFLELYDEKGRSILAPPTGEFTAWKACKSYDGHYVYVKLRIPAHAQRVNGGSLGKIRTSSAIVEEIWTRGGKLKYNEAYSFIYNGGSSVRYEIGKEVFPEKFDDNESNDYGAGINCHLYKDQCKQWFT